MPGPVVLVEGRARLMPTDFGHLVFCGWCGRPMRDGWMLETWGRTGQRLRGSALCAKCGVWCGTAWGHDPAGLAL